MADANHLNADFVRRGFEALAAGDVNGAINQFSPDLKYYGGDQYGRSREFGSRDEFFGMALEGMALNDEYTNEVVDTFAVGESLVMVHVHGHRRSRATQEVLDTDYVMVLRIEDGVITHGVDLIDESAQSYFARLAPAS
jgi:ketosteroid isomerase-like protein